MGFIVRLGARKAFLRHGEWRCADAAVEALLNRETEAWIRETGGPALESVDPEAEVALEIARRLGALITAHVASDPRLSRQIYFSRRQYCFDFGARDGG
jgi:hypothetical protein